MAKEYIEKEAFKQYLLDLKNQVNEIVPGQSVISGTTLSELIDLFPAAADVQEVRHGRWEWDGEYICSVCGYREPHRKPLFCGGCGASMDEVDE